jgi:uncharacterized protein with PIN domain
MLALRMYRASRCPSCGGDLAVTTAPENEGMFKKNLPVTCHRCVAFSVSHQAYADYPHPHSLIHQVPHKPIR